MTTSMTVKSFWLRAFDFTIKAPSKAAREFGAQCLITSASIAMNAGFAQSHGILDPWFAWAQAIGFEWTYLRGLASAGKTRSKWVDYMNMIAFVSVILYGVMFCLVQYHVIPDQPDKVLAVFLSLVHVVPIGMTGFCAAMIHRAVKLEDAAKEDVAMSKEDERLARIQAARDELEIERLRKQQELDLWRQAQELKQSLKSASKPLQATERPPCPICGVELDAQDHALYKSAQARNAKFRGCKPCREKEV